MNPAEELRAAAARMRELAGKATPGPWSGDPTGTVCANSDLVPDGHGGELLPPDGPMEVAECYRSEQPAERGANAAHIAAWHPNVALAVAALVEGIAEHWTTAQESGFSAPLPLAVARAFMGGEQQ